MSNWHGKCGGKSIYFMTNIKRNKFLCSFFTCCYYFKFFQLELFIQFISFWYPIIFYCLMILIVSEDDILPLVIESNTRKLSVMVHIYWSEVILFLSFQIYKSIQINRRTIVIFKIIHIVIYFRRNFHDVGIYLNAVLDMEVFMLTVLLVPLSLGGRLTKGICSYDAIRLPCIYNLT